MGGYVLDYFLHWHSGILHQDVYFLTFVFMGMNCNGQKS